jgi:hypothetical protein
MKRPPQHALTDPGGRAEILDADRFTGKLRQSGDTIDDLTILLVLLRRHAGNP